MSIESQTRRRRKVWEDHKHVRVSKGEYFASRWRKSWKSNRNDWISKASTRHTRHQEETQGKEKTNTRKEQVYHNTLYQLWT
jgi:hypothetical protein